MASTTDCTEGTVTRLQSDEDFSSKEQSPQDVEDRLVSLSDKINICVTILNDLKDLSDVLVRRSLQDVSLPPPN